MVAVLPRGLGRHAAGLVVREPRDRRLGGLAHLGKHAAVLTGVLGLCASPLLLYLLFSSSYHPWTFYSPAIALGLLVFLSRQSGMSVRAWIVAVAGALALGGALASDRLVLLGSIGPLFLAGAGVAIRHPTRQGRMVGLVTSAVVAGAIAIGAAVLTPIMEAAGFVTSPRNERWTQADLFLTRSVGPSRRFSG